MIIEALPEFSQITDNLWLSGIPKNIDKFKYVFNFVGKAVYYISCGQQVTICPFNDCDFMPNETMLHELADAVLVASKKGPTLVHCAAGINRSALVLGMALIKDGMKPVDAINLMRTKRGDIVLYNKTFENWLLTQG